MNEVTQLIQELLRFPAENLEVEIKNWLDLNAIEKKADVAKELIALANHGGGYLILGFDELDDGFKAAQKPTGTSSYNQDHINSIIERYSDPTFHCEVLQVPHPDTGIEYPVVIVPGGHKIPIHAKRDGPNGQHIRKLACYIRRAGGKSETPQNSGEWQELLQRCVRNNQEQLLDAIRSVVTGDFSTETTLSHYDLLKEWIESSKKAWHLKVDEYDAQALSKYPFGFFSCAFMITDVSNEYDLNQLIDLTRTSSPGVSGWSPFVTLRPPEYAPYRDGDFLEAFVYTATGPTAKPFYTVFWRVSPRGFGFSISGHQEDGWSNSISVGTVLDPRLQTRLVAEYLMFMANFASKIAEEDSRILTHFEWTGLKNRQLVDILQVGVPLFNRVSGTNKVTTEFTFELSQLQNNLPEVVEKIVSKLFDHFSFFRAPLNFYQEQVNYLRKQSYFNF